MKCLVIYFSQTGNTQKVAQAIRTGIAESCGHCNIAKLKDTDPHGLRHYDLIGLGSPCFATAPGNVTDFVQAMRFVGGKHAFVFYTHGGQPAAFLPSLVPRLHEKGLVVLGTRGWYGDCHLLHHIDPYPTAGHPDEIDLREAHAFGGEMAERSRRVLAGEIDLIPDPPSSPLPDLSAILNSTEPLFAIDSFAALLKYDRGKCRYPKCRLCEVHCPVYGIDLSVNPPVLASPCINCEFCARLCPTGALDMSEWVQGMAKMTDALTRRVILPDLERAEREGTFRRLLPKERLDLETYGYMVHTRHPQWIIGKGKQ